MVDASAFPATCSGRLAPTITEVTAGLDRAQPMTSCAGSHPASAAIDLSASAFSNDSSVQYVSFARWAWREAMWLSADGPLCCP